MIRSSYMQNLMTSTYPMVAVEAIKNGWDGAWERLIAQRLRIDYKSDHSEAVELINAQPLKTFIDKSLQAAYLITSSTIRSNETEAIPKTN